MNASEHLSDVEDSLDVGHHKHGSHQRLFSPGPLDPNASALSKSPQVCKFEMKMASRGSISAIS